MTPSLRSTSLRRCLPNLRKCRDVGLVIRPQTIRRFDLPECLGQPVFDIEGATRIRVCLIAPGRQRANRAQQGVRLLIPTRIAQPQTELYVQLLREEAAERAVRGISQLQVRSVLAVHERVHVWQSA